LYDVRESIGEYLARERELRGITLDELAESTRIPLRSLERLEAGAFDRDPDGFARGFVRTVAEALGLEPDQTVIRMLPEPGPATTGAGIPTSRTLLLALLAAVIAVGVPWTAWHLLSEASAVAELSTPSGAREQIVRRDEVRRLAESIDALEHGGAAGEARSQR
jgi:transcriptional regulator with XRE-family HTH domain